MSEFSKFLRYIIPGLIFGIEYILLILFSNYICFSELLGPGLKDIVNTGSAVIGFLAAGGMGFIFSGIYHIFFHICGRLNISVLRINQLKAIKAAEEKNLISFERIEDGKITNNIKADSLSQSGAWRIITYYWYSKRKLSKNISGSDVRTKSLSDLVHALGTIVVANVAAILAWCITMHHLEFAIKFWWAGALAFFLFLIHLFNYIFVIRDCEGVINAIFLEELYYTKNRTKQKIRFLVSEKDIKCRWIKW